ncbi:MAG: cell division ATP-binding protein FtsE [Deltaproteobacteria bacterium GWC2_42_51]|nr:MAG: cell division ATP-binding protein FtsE [Deltaproteobacteria bacterium GWA2_42_85]OGP26523.1 MAG: cell division ATP-binding protein FtsE [Deltaproteobacteria bacterium GWB2_42_7]OGP37439.1 MAG: cell division ATP-binding protein FtsE [Deltaproteobacteria bacterium GWC2_42_51]OGP40129.1 MAG: cell division ATP-binding protein FtsE [Deltaproteobacteria bacterium GWD2_42_10]OGP47521.1 MAG: cell division ATP-binding protein FtsE [Deltaproteobacteria bacterium GWF2_42_12]OGQ26151.1 MAG: cell d
MINMFHLYKTYEGTISALTDITLKIDKGEFIFITGASGAGKSTLLKLMFCIERPTQGQIIIAGKNISRFTERDIPLLRRKMGFVFQDFKLLNNKTVFDNIALALRITGVTNREISKKVLKVLTYLGLQHRANFKPLMLSGGEQQRVAIARALAKEPSILLADEPTGNLDPERAMDIINLFNDINAKGTTVIVATHDRALIDKFSKRTIYLEKGKIVN